MVSFQYTSSISVLLLFLILERPFEMSSFFSDQFLLNFLIFFVRPEALSLG